IACDGNGWRHVRPLEKRYRFYSPRIVFRAVRFNFSRQARPLQRLRRRKRPHLLAALYAPPCRTAPTRLGAPGLQDPIHMLPKRDQRPRWSRNASNLRRRIGILRFKARALPAVLGSDPPWKTRLNLFIRKA